MKKRNLLGISVVVLAFGAIAGAASAQALKAKDVSAAAGRTLYCKVEQSWWKADGAAVGIYYWGGDVAAPSWPGLRMSPVAGETDLWSITIDASVPNCIFTRVNGSGNVADWGAKTSDLAIPADKNLYTITSTSPVWGDPGVTGEWGVYNPEGGESSSSSEESSSEESSSSSEASKKYDVTSDYALIVNGVAHEMLKNDSPLDPSFDEYYVLDVDVAADEHVWLYNSSTDVEFNITNVAGSESFEVVVDDIICTVGGTFDFYAKFKYGADQLYIQDNGGGDESSSEEPEPEDPDVPAVNGHYLVGNAAFTGSEETAWKFAGGILSDKDEEDLDNVATYHNVEIAADAEVKVRFYYGAEDTQWVYAVLGEEYEFASLTDDGNVKFSAASTYSLYFKYVEEAPMIFIVDEDPTPEESSSSEEPEPEDPDVPEVNGHYLVGNAAFTGSEETAWKFAGGILSDKDEEDLDNVATYHNVEIAADAEVKVRFYYGAEDTQWVYAVLGEEYEFASLTDDGNVKFSAASTYSLYFKYVEEAPMIFIVDENAEPPFVDESLEGRWYVVGEGSFNAEYPSWSYKGGILLDEPGDGSTDLAVGKSVGLSAGDVVKFRVGQAAAGEGFLGYSAIQEGHALFNVDEMDNLIVKTTGTYNIYINASGELYIYDAASPVVLTGSIFFSPGAFGVPFGDLYLYSWKVEAEKEIPAVAWPGVKLSEVADVRVSTMLNFAGTYGSVIEIPGAALGDATKFIINNGTEAEVPVQSADLEYHDGYFYSMFEAEGNAEKAAAAEVALDIDLGIDGAEGKSVCNFDANDAKAVLQDYEKLSIAQKALVDDSTFYTIDVNPASETGKIDVLGSNIVAMISKSVVNAGEGSIFSIKATSSTNKTLIITLAAVGAVAALGVGFFVFKKKRQN